eukprot:g6273.t1
MTREYRVAEFYSGIGGFHFAVRCAIPTAKVVAAFDVDEDANCVYIHSTGLTPTQMNLQSVPIKVLESLEAEVWLLSPPCQPYTRQGHRLDDQDPRSFSFLTLLEKLDQMKKSIPEFVCLENVVGFEISRTREKMMKVFRNCKLNCVEFILSPEQFGIPYSRPRYFCLARKRPFSLSSNQIHFQLPNTDQNERISLDEFLDDEVEDALYVPEKFIKQCGPVMNVVGCGEATAAVNCFTKSYGGRYFKGTGSFLATQHRNWIPFINVLQELCCTSSFTEDTNLFSRRTGSTEERRMECSELLTDLLRRMRIRYFSPMEVGRLHSFPEDFTFPSEITRRRQYALLGNSLSVTVVAQLLCFLIIL